MFLGHFGVGLTGKKFAPRVSLGVFFLAAQFVDLLWPTLLLLGIERVRIAPDATVVTPLAFEHYPVSHSLLTVGLWAALFGGTYLLLHRDRVGALVLGTLVLSHWFLDVLVHRPDLPIVPGGSTHVGLNAWSSVALTLLIEISVFSCGLWLYARSTVPRDRLGTWGLVGLIAFLLLVYTGNLFGPPPPSTTAIAWVGQAQWLIILWGFWLDRHRTLR